MKRSTPFQTTDESVKEIQKSLTTHLIKMQREMMSQVLSPQNVLGYSHGSNWKHPGNPEDNEGSMETHEAEYSIPYKRLIDGDLKLVEESLENISSSFHRQLMQSMYALIGRTCDRTGNVVSASASTLPEAFIQMLEKVEFGVDREGNVSLPQIHTGTDHLISALQSQPTEFEQRVEEIVQRKTKEALEKEAQRICKFRTYE